jgi:hypothetical protein
VIKHQDSGFELRDHLCLPPIDDKALAGLKFSDALPGHPAVVTLATRLADLDNADPLTGWILAGPGEIASLWTPGRG